MKLGPLAALACGAVLLAVLPGVLSPFQVRVLQTLFFGAGLATAWNILGGGAGYWSFGHAAFIGLGAFVAALFQEHWPLTSPEATFAVAIVLGGAACALLALVIAYPILSLRGAYFAIAMLGISLILSELSNSVDLFEGSLGIVISAVGPQSMPPENFYYYAFLVLLTAALAIAYGIRVSRFGYGLTAIREDEDTAKMLGVPTERYKIVALLVSAAMTGVLGAVFAYSLGYVTTGSVFRLDLGLDMIVYSLLGGIGTLMGPVVGAAVMTVLTQVVLSGLLQVHMLVTGLLIVGLVLLMPNGILGLLGSERLRLRRRPDTPAVEAEKAAAESLSIAIRPPSPEEAVVPGTAETVLRLEDISVQFRGLRALDGVNLEIAKGSISTVIGPNGAGKSTLFNVITGYLSPTTGEVWHRGERIDSLPTQQLSRRGIGRVFQISRPFQGLSVFDNVMVGALFGKSGSRDPRKVTEAALELTGLDALRDERASGLPVGHLRRLELARVIATRPDLILADEPCAGLNPTETLDIINILAEVRRRGATVLLVEHDMAAVMRISDFIYVIAAGAKIAEGLPKEIVRHPRVVEAYLGRPLDELAKPPAPAARGDDLAAQPSA